MALPGRAWKAGKPLWLRLPRVYRANEIAGWLTAYWDNLLVEIYAKVMDAYDRQLRIINADEKWVDFLAPLLGWDGTHWNTVWPLEGKKTLLLNSFQGQRIWETKGSRDTLVFVLAAVGIRNNVQVDGDFIIDSSEIGDPIGYDPWSFTVFLPPEYESTDKYREAVRIIELFSPAWCEWQIVYDEEQFRIIELLTAEDGSVIATEDGTDELIALED